MEKNFIRKDVIFKSDGISCAAWLYLPHDKKPPVIVMAHGLGGIKEMCLDAYAEHFAANGFACFLFDYRYFGESEGNYRQKIKIKSQLADWESAINYVKNCTLVDSNKVLIIGTSFSGGYVITLASRHKELIAAVAQCPFTDGISSALIMNKLSLLKVSICATIDILCSLFGFKPLMIKLAGPKGSTALMPVNDYQSYYRLVPEKSNFKSKVYARTAFQVLCYCPGKSVKTIEVPIFFAICNNDTVAPANKTYRYAKQSNFAEIKHYPIGHFDIYSGKEFEEAIGDYIVFFHKQLKKVELKCQLPTAAMPNSL